VEQLKKALPDLILVMGLSQLIPQHILSLASNGAIGSHPTLLPQARGRAAIPWSILKGLKRSGLTFFFLVEEADAGDVVCQKSWDITEEDTATTLYQKMLETGVALAGELAGYIKQGNIPRTPQPKEAPYWPGRKPEDGKILWSATEKEVYDLIRATTHPYPGAFSYLKGKKIIFWEAKRTGVMTGVRPGEIASVNADGLVIGTKDGSVCTKGMQRKTCRPFCANYL
jgi:methionyl-tRNA formyltransferase